MSTERDMRKRVVRALRELDAIPIENGVGVGTPDINCVGDIWIELKSIDAWPTKPETRLRIEHYTPEQKVWAIRRIRAGGKVLLLLKVADDWMLFDGKIATDILGRSTRETLLDFARASWSGGLDEDQLLMEIRYAGRGSEGG